MKLPIVRKEENSQIVYAIPINNGRIKRTISIDDVQCTIARGEVVFIELKNLDVGLTREFEKLCTKFEEVVGTSDGYRIHLSRGSDEKVASCLVNVDVDENGQILSLEII